MENQRKKIVIVVSIVGIILLLVSVFYLAKKYWFSKTEVPKEASVFDNLPKYNCTFKDDKEAYSFAMQKAEVGACSCISLEGVRKECETASLGMLNFQQIVRQMDASRCKELAKEQDQKLCVAAVASRIKSLSKDPGLISNVYLLNGDYAKAVEVLSAIIQKDSKDSESMLALALAYANLAIAEHKESEYVPKALDLVEKVILINSSSSEAYRIQGFIFETKPDYEASVQSYTQAIDLDGNNVLAYVGRGHVYNMMGKVGNALADLDKAKALDKNQTIPQLYSQLCRLESQGSPLELAIKDCGTNAKISVGVAKAEAYGMLASLYIRAGRIDEAVLSVQQALGYGPDNSSVRVTASKVYLEKGDLSAAEKYAKEAISLDGTRSASYLQLATVNLKQDNADKAIENGLKALSLLDSDISVLTPEKSLVKQKCYNLLADAYAKKGDSANEAKYRTANI